MNIDLGLLIVRLALGPMLIVHGWNKIAGPGGIAGTTRWFDSLGLRPAAVHARVAAATEMGAGLFVTLGLLTGLTALAVVGLMVVAMRTDHWGKGYFVFKGGWEYTLLVAMVVVGLAATGPGECSADAVFHLDFAGTIWAVVAAAGGVLAAAALLVLSYRPSQTETSG
jgi:putative oxidoreductase